MSKSNTINSSQFSMLIRKCANHIGLPGNLGKVATAKALAERFGYEGSARDIIIQHADYLRDNNISVPRRGAVVQARKRAKKRLRTVAKKYSAENQVKHKTDAVIKVAEQLRSAGVPFVEEKPVSTTKKKKWKYVGRDGKLVLLDFYVKKPLNFIIEVDGGYHETRKEEDAEKDEFTFSRGYGRTLRVTNEQVLDPSFNIVEEAIKAFPYLKDRFEQLKPDLLEVLHEQNLQHFKSI